MDHLEAKLDGICEQEAKGDLDYKGFLAQALEAEWRARYQRGVEGRLKLARFPWIKTLEQFDFDFQPSINRKVMRELAGLSFVERAEHVVRLGPPGGGQDPPGRGPGRQGGGGGLLRALPHAREPHGEVGASPAAEPPRAHAPADWPARGSSSSTGSAICALRARKPASSSGAL